MEAVEAVELFSESSARYRYRVPVSVIRELQYEGSRYSAEFDVGGWLWRFHIQERAAEGQRFLALHLQSCAPGAVAVHFKLTAVCMRDPLQSRSKTFNCTFKKAGSAWGLHQFIAMEQLLHPESGYVYTVQETGTRCVDFEVTLQVENGGGNERVPLVRSATRSITPTRSVGGAGGSAFMGGGRVSPSRGPSVRPNNGSGIPPGLNSRMSYSPSRVGTGALVPMGDGLVDRPGAMSVPVGPRRGFYSDPGGGQVVPSDSALNASGVGSRLPGGAAVVRAPLTYPFEHLESLCDMSFDVQGVRVKAHRCVIGARMQPLLPEQMLPLQVGCIVSIAVPLDVFTTFLRYVYTEEYPESGVLPPESLLDLYLLAAACEFYDLSAVCIRCVRPLLTSENILPIVLTRYNAADEVLTSLYLHVLLDSYDALIQDRQFEEIPGHLFRRLSLILYRKETVPNAPIPPMRNTLGRQLAWLAESGEYSDYDWVVGPQQYTVHAHRYILACRSVLFSQAMNPRGPGPVPSFATNEFDFSLRSWQKLLLGMYRRHLDTARDFSAEDIAVIFKMQHVLIMDGQLKREADEAFNNTNALRLLIYAVKHQIPELHERAITYVANNFHTMIRNDPQAWELISELPQTAVVSLFRTVTDHQQV
ncbi:BTB/POZ domain containing protein [Novymonas esmeraldas]|uniref:BTB/POZ domain containing protein n=1 Tax=Novymonas esmeraldas TaxID=1808958 RepID=A0AAW0EW13_9TRYP